MMEVTASEIEQLVNKEKTRLDKGICQVRIQTTVGEDDLSVIPLGENEHELGRYRVSQYTRQEIADEVTGDIQHEFDQL